MATVERLCSIKILTVSRSPHTAYNEQSLQFLAAEVKLRKSLKSLATRTPTEHLFEQHWIMESILETKAVTVLQFRPASRTERFMRLITRVRSRLTAR